MPVARIRYRRLIAYFSDPLQKTIACFWDPFTLTILASSAILKLKEGFYEFFTLRTVFVKVISLMYEKIYFGDRVPLRMEMFPKKDLNMLRFDRDMRILSLK